VGPGGQKSVTYTHISVVKNAETDVFTRCNPTRRRISDRERVDVVDVLVAEDDLAVQAVLVHDFEHEDEVVVGTRQELCATHDRQI